MNLFEINGEIKNCISTIIDENTGEVIGEEADFDKLNSLKMLRDEKIENLACWYKNLIAESAALKGQKEQFALRERQSKSKADRIKAYLQSVLNGESYKSEKCMITYRKSEVVEIDENAELPEEYLIFKAPCPNKTEIKKALKNGIDINGCEIVEKQNIGVK